MKHLVELSEKDRKLLERLIELLERLEIKVGFKDE